MIGPSAFTRSLLVSLLLVAVSGVAAARDPGYDRTGPYALFGASVGTAVGYDAEIESAVGLSGRVDSAFGAQARVGYRLLPWLAAEGQFDWLPGFDAKQANDLTVIDGTTWMVSANAKAWPRPEDRFQPFALIGLGYLRSWNQPIIGPAYGGGGFAARFGGGLDAHITRHWLLSIEVAYVLPTGAVRQFDSVGVGLGLQYRF